MEDTKDHIFYHSIYMKCPEQANLYRQKVDQCLLGAWGGTSNEYRVSFWGDDNVSQWWWLYNFEYTKTH